MAIVELTDERPSPSEAHPALWNASNRCSSIATTTS